MGVKGKKSQRGCGDKDELVRDAPLFINVTKFDKELLNAAAQQQQRSKADILIELIRTHLSDYAQYVTQEDLKT